MHFFRPVLSSLDFFLVFVSCFDRVSHGARCDQGDLALAL